jgi:hypothetical protein
VAFGPMRVLLIGCLHVGIEGAAIGCAAFADGGTGVREVGFERWGGRAGGFR